MSVSPTSSNPNSPDNYFGISSDSESSGDESKARPSSARKVNSFHPRTQIVGKRNAIKAGKVRAQAPTKAPSSNLQALIKAQVSRENIEKFKQMRVSSNTYLGKSELSIYGVNKSNFCDFIQVILGIENNEISTLDLALESIKKLPYEIENFIELFPLSLEDKKSLILHLMTKNIPILPSLALKIANTENGDDFIELMRLTTGFNLEASILNVACEAVKLASTSYCNEDFLTKFPLSIDDKKTLLRVCADHSYPSRHLAIQSIDLAIDVSMWSIFNKVSKLLKESTHPTETILRKVIRDFVVQIPSEFRPTSDHLRTTFTEFIATRSELFLNSPLFSEELFQFFDSEFQSSSEENYLPEGFERTKFQDSLMEKRTKELEETLMMDRSLMDYFAKSANLTREEFIRIIKEILKTRPDAAPDLSDLEIDHQTKMET